MMECQVKSEDVSTIDTVAWQIGGVDYVPTFANPDTDPAKETKIAIPTSQDYSGASPLEVKCKITNTVGASHTFADATAGFIRMASKCSFSTLFFATSPILLPV